MGSCDQVEKSKMLHVCIGPSSEKMGKRETFLSTEIQYMPHE